MRDHLPVSTVNELKSLRMTVARNLTELLEYAPRTTLGFTDTGDGEELPSKLEERPAADETPASQPTTIHMLQFGTFELGASGSPGNSSAEVVPAPAASSLAAATPASTPDPHNQILKELAAGPLFDGDAASVLTRRLPLSVLLQASQSQTLPSRLRGRVALATFIRAILLGNEAAARELAPRVMDSYPKLKRSIGSWLPAKSPDEESFAAGFMMLENPGLRFEVDAGAGRVTPLNEIDSLRDNWWPSQESPEPRDQTYPSFLSATEKQSADDEWKKLSEINAPSFLCTAAIEQAKRHPHDTRVPEALYRCLTAVHLGCSNSQGTDLAKSAFGLLHHRYAESDWAAKGQFWYRANNCGDASLHRRP